MEETTTGFTRQNSYTLALLTLSFIIGEISHFLISVVNMEVARDLHYGDLSCAQHPNESQRFDKTNEFCDKFTSDSDDAKVICENNEGCLYLENGQGMKYQILAGPTFVIVFTISGVIMGYLADKLPR